MSWRHLIAQTARRMGRRRLNWPEEPGLHGFWAARGRVAAIGPWFSLGKRVRTFPEFDPAALTGFSPNVVCSDAAQLLRLAREALARRLWLPDLDRGLICWKLAGEGLLQSAERDLLWRAFQIPVFEEIRGPGGELLAWECEAHDGLHIAERNAVFAGAGDGELAVCVGRFDGQTSEPLALPVEGAVDQTPCPCGRSGRRLTRLRNRPREARAAVAAG